MSGRVERWAARGSVVAVVVAIAVAGVRAALDGWYPIGDNALLTLRARDVLTAHHPWLGTWTSASLSIGRPINNPGPLQFDLLAPFAKLDATAGMAVGVAVLNAVAVVLIAVFARRVGGDRLVATAMVAAGSLTFAMGSELLVDPWQPHNMLLPFLLLIVLSVALASGDVVALPWAVGVVSFLVQTHLSYAVLAPGVLAAGLAWVAIVLRPRSGDGMDVRAARRGLRRAVLVAVVVGLACWAQPLWEQVARDGNLLEVAGNAGGGDVVVGPRSGVRLAGTVIGDPSGWLLRGSFADTFRHEYGGEQVAPVGPPNAGVRSLPTAALSVLGIVALLAATAWSGRRRRHPQGAPIAVVVGTAVVLALATCASLPASAALGIAAHQLRWLWPIAIAAAVLPWASLLPRRPAITSGLAAVAIGLGVAALAPANAGAGPSADVAARTAVRAVAAAIDDVPRDRVVYFDGRTVPFAEPFSGPLLLELQRRGIEFEVEEADALLHQVGPARRGPEEATAQVWLLVGDPGADPPPGAEVLARIDGVEPAERQRAIALAEQLRTSWDASRVRLSERGEAARRAGALGELAQPGWESDTDLLIDRAALARLVVEEWIDLDSLPEGAEEWGRIEQRRRRYSVVVALGPLA